jgi:hypothetical protein
MNPQLLIDAIVRQTTVLIARLSTANGVRSPLSHIAHEVFVGLVRELESQGVGKKVIADMFGLALRSYRQKVQRVSESQTAPGMTLWGAVQSYLAERESASRSEVLDRFKYDDPISVRGILNDLIESGLVLRIGRGDETRYRVATAEELDQLDGPSVANPADGNAALVWVHVYRESPVRRDRLAQLMSLPQSAIDAAVVQLVADGRIRVESRSDGEYCLTDHCLIPVGQAAGWEAAVVDHHRAVLNALAAKVTGGSHVSARNDEVGGTTLTFDLWPGHPREAEVRRLLQATRDQVIPLWDEVTEHNRENSSDGAYQVTFYFGQYLMGADDER